MSQIVKDSLAQQFNLGNPKAEEEVFQLGGSQDNSAPSIQIKISGMLNEAMTKPQSRRGKPSIDIKIS